MDKLSAQGIINLKKEQPKDKLIKSKLLSILTGLDKDLLHQFQRQILLEGNARRDLVLVFKYLVRYHPNFNRKELGQTYAYQKIFKEPFNYARLMKGISKVYKRLNKFLISQELEQSTFNQDFLLAKAYNRYNLRVEFEALIAKKTDIEIVESNIDDCLGQLQWNHLAYFSGMATKIEEGNDVLKKAQQALNLCFVGIKLRHLCELANRKSFLGDDYIDFFEGIVIQYCQNNQEKLSNTDLLYWLAYQLIAQKKDSLFKQLRKRYWETWCTLAKEDQVALLTCLMNYAAGKIRKNEETYVTVLHELYRLGINKQVLIVNQRFVEDHFINLIYTSSYLEIFDWIYDFIAEWNEKIKSSLPDSTYNLSMARLTFAQGLFEQCQTHLLKIKHNNYGQFVRAKSLEIACSYELNDPLFRIETQCKAFENYLRRKEVVHKQNTRGSLVFIRIVRLLTKVNPNKSQLEEIFRESEFVVFQKWVEEKIKALK